MRIEYSIDEQVAEDEEERISAAKHERMRTKNRVEKIVGDVTKCRISYAQGIELIKKNCIDEYARMGHCSSHRNIIELLKKHPCLRATGNQDEHGEIVLDGIEAIAHEPFSPDAMHDFFEFAIQCSPQKLSVQFDSKQRRTQHES